MLVDLGARKAVAFHFCRAAGNNGVQFDVLDHNRSGGDDGASSNADAGENNGPESDPYIRTNDDRFIFAGPVVVRIPDPGRAAHALADYADLMIVTPDKSHVVCNHGVGADSATAFHSVALPDVDVVPDN